MVGDKDFEAIFWSKLKNDSKKMKRKELNDEKIYQRLERIL